MRRLSILTCIHYSTLSSRVPPSAKNANVSSGSAGSGLDPSSPLVLPQLRRLRRPSADRASTGALARDVRRFRTCTYLTFLISASEKYAFRSRHSKQIACQGHRSKRMRQAKAERKQAGSGSRRRGGRNRATRSPPARPEQMRNCHMFEMEDLLPMVMQWRLRDPK